MLAEALRRVPLGARVVLELAYWKGCDCVEIARVLDVPLNTAYSRLRRARLALRERFEQLAPDQVEGVAMEFDWPSALPAKRKAYCTSQICHWPAARRAGCGHPPSSTGGLIAVLLHPEVERIAGLGDALLEGWTKAARRSRASTRRSAGRLWRMRARRSSATASSGEASACASSRPPAGGIARVRSLTRVTRIAPLSST